MFGLALVRTPIKEDTSAIGGNFNHLVLIEVLEFLFKQEQLGIFLIEAGSLPVAVDALDGPDLSSSNWLSRLWLNHKGRGWVSSIEGEE